MKTPKRQEVKPRSFRDWLTKLLLDQVFDLPGLPYSLSPLRAAFSGLYLVQSV